MKNKITSFESIMEASNNLVELSRNIISYFTTNDQFDAVLADDSSQECHIFDLAVRYLAAITSLNVIRLLLNWKVILQNTVPISKLTTDEYT